VLVFLANSREKQQQKSAEKREDGGDKRINTKKISWEVKGKRCLNKQTGKNKYGMMPSKKIYLCRKYTKLPDSAGGLQMITYIGSKKGSGRGQGAVQGREQRFADSA